MGAGRITPLIGLAAGLVLASHLQAYPLPAPLDRLHLELVPAALVAGASSLLALWPDLLDPAGWLAPERRRWTSLIVGLLLAVAGWAWAAGRSWPPWPSVEPWPWHAASAALAGGAGALLLGPRAGRVLAALAEDGRSSALAQSLVSAALLAGLSAWLAESHEAAAVAPIPLLLAWGIVLHLPAGVLAPGGVMPAYPLSRLRLRLPPAWAAWGEAALALAALAVGLWSVATW